MELFDTFCLVWSSISSFRDENVSHKTPMCISGKITTLATKALFSTLNPKWKQTSDYECTHEMELFDTYFVWFGQVLAISGMKTLVIRQSDVCKW